MTLRVLFHVQHLLGIGHLRRAALLSKGMADAGLSVTLASGGMPVAGLEPGGAEFVQLPAARAADMSFRLLLDAEDRPVDDAWREIRAAACMDVWQRVRPHVLLTELFPFGRRQFRFELLPVLTAARAAAPRTVIAASVRDILVAAQDAKKNNDMLTLFQRHYDQLLVHGDPGVARFEATFPLADAIADRTHYTGYVVEPPDPSGNTLGTGEVLVSAGGGAVGLPLLRAALTARALSAAGNLPWRLLVGQNESDAAVAELTAMAPPGVIVERARADFPALLANCAASISQGGYNTVMETLVRRRPAVLVPFTEGRPNSEQGRRAELLAARGVVEVVAEADLTPARLAAALDRAMARDPVDLRVDTGGIAATAALVRRWAEGAA